MKVSLLALVLLLSACAAQRPMVWVKPGSSDEQFRRDQMACRQSGMQSAVANGLSGNMFVEMWIRDETVKCLEGLGYTRQS